MEQIIRTDKGIICEYKPIVKFAKVRPDAIIPTKREEDAGLDIYANFEQDYMIIEPHRTVMIPTGIACVCDKEYCLIAKERGSTGTKGLAQRSGVIDSGYRSEIFIPITNTTESTFFICKKDKIETYMDDYLCNGTRLYPYEKAIAQLLVVPVPKVKVEEITYEELQTVPSDRGNGKLGSSGK